MTATLSAPAAGITAGDGGVQVLFPTPVKSQAPLTHFPSRHVWSHVEPVPPSVPASAPLADFSPATTATVVAAAIVSARTMEWILGSRCCMRELSFERVRVMVSG